MVFDFFKLNREGEAPQPPVDPQQPLYIPPDTIVTGAWNPKPPAPRPFTQHPAGKTK